MLESATLEESPHLLLDRSRTTAPPAPPLRDNCTTCRVSVLCLPGALRQSDLRGLEAMLLTTRKVRSGHTIYRDGDPFRFIYVVRRGLCKTGVTRADGHAQVAEFHIPGDVMGLEGIAQDIHRTTATALEDSEVCVMPYGRLSSMTAASSRTPDLLAHLMSQGIVRGNHLISLLGFGRAQERLAAFVLDFSQRHAARGLSPREFRLGMSREDIGSYLCLNAATVSRTFSLFRQRGFVKLQWRRVIVTDLEGLKREYDLRLS